MNLLSFKHTRGPKSIARSGYFLIAGNRIDALAHDIENIALIRP